MNILPPVTIQICTFNRPVEIRQTIAALKANLCYSGELLWLICDDHSPDGYADALRDEGYDVLVTPKNGGWARNVNNGLRYIRTEFTFFIEDDYVLRKPLNLDVGVALMMTVPTIGYLRYRGSAGEHIVYHAQEADIREFLPDYQDGVGLPGRLTYLLLDSGSPALNLYTHGAHLKRRSFHTFYNLYPEGLKLGTTEEVHAHHVKDLMKTPDAPTLAILPGWIPMWFDHVGHSYQMTEFDKEHGR